MHHSRPTPTSRTVRVKPVSLLTIIIGEMIVVLMVLLFSSEPALTTSLVGLDQGEDFTLPRLYPQLKSSARSKEPRPAQNISTGHVSQHPAINSTKISKAPALSSNGTISSKSSSTPSANTTLTTTTKRPPNLITRTTDAIYKVLTGYFSHDDDEEEEEGGEQKADDQGFGDKLTTTVQPSSTKVPAKEHNDHKDQRQTQEHQIHQVNQKPQQQQQDAKNHNEHRQPELHQEHKDHRQDQAHKQHHDNQKPQQQQQDAKNNNEHRKPEPHQEHKEHHDLKHNDHEQTEQHQDANSHKQQGHKDHQDQEHQKHHGNQKPQQQQQDAKNHNEHRQPERHQEHNDHEQAEQHQDARSHKQHQQHQDHNGHKIHEGQHEHYDHGQPQQHQDAKDRGDHQHHEQQRDNMGHKDHQENRPHHDHQHHQEPEKYQKPDEHKDNHKQHKQHQDHNGHKIHEDHERQREHYDHGQSQQHQDAKDHGDHQHPEQHQDNMDHKDHQENRLLHDHQHHQESQQYQEPNEHRDSKQQHQQHQQDHRDQKTHKDHATKITSQSPMSLTTVKIVPVVTTTPHPAIKPATTHVTVRTSRAPVTSGTTRKMNTTSAGIPMDTTTTMSVDSKPMPVNHTNKSSPTTATTSSKLNRTTRKEGTDATHTTATMTPEWGPTATATTTMRPKLSLPPHFHLNFSDQNYTTTTTPADGHYNHSTGKLFDHYHHHHQHHQPEHHKTTIKEEATSLYQTLAPNITNTASPTLAPTLPTTAITTIPSRQASTGDIVANQDYQEVRLNSSTATFASSSIHLFGLLSRAFTSISSELTYLNRTTRLAPDKLDTTEEGDEIDSALEHGGREIENSPRIEHNAANWSSLANQIGDKPSHSRASDRLSNLRTGPTGVGSSDDSPEAASGGSKQQQVATASREDILLLCKLLHKHLDQSSSSLSFKNSTSLNTQLNDELNLHGLGKNSAQLADSTSKPANDTATTTLKPPPAKQQPDDIGHHELDSNLDQRWLVSEPNAELNELQHGERLLETEFVIERRDSGSPGGKPGAGQSHHESHYEEAGLRLLSELYNLGQASRMAAASGASTGSTSSDEPVEVGGGLVASKNISLFVWSKTEGRGGRLRLVYWLLEQLRPSLASRSRPDGGSTIANTAKAAVRFRVLELAEALELLDQLDHSLVQQTINEAGLVRPRGVLVTSYKRERELTAAGGPPRVIDDSLHMDQQGTGSSGSGSKSPSTLQLIIDRFSQASFGENFHLYLILFVVILFIIILCFAIPALCCKCMTPASSTSTSASSLVTGSNSTNNRPNRGGGHLRRNLRDNGRARPGASKPPPEDNTRRGPARRGFYRSTDPLRQSITSISGALAAGTANSRSEEGRQFDAIGKLDDTPAIWRKLSNSTTTMTKDEICTREDDGQLELVRNNNNRLDDESGEYSGQFMPASKTSDGSKFEWYTFEDNKEQAIRHHGGLAAAPRDFRDQESRNNKSTTGQQRQVVNKPAQTMVVHDKFRLTKSVQTYARAEHLLDGAQRAAAPWAEASGTGGDEIKRDGGEPLLNTMAYRDRLETRNSNTLTKSELVMLKEKLIPIGQQLRESAEHDNTKQQQRAMVIDHDYVNTAATTTTGSSSQQQRPSHQQPVVTKPPSRHIDSLSVEESTNGDRTRGRSPGESFAEQQPKRSPSEDAAASANSQRAPSMRYLELPSHAQGKVDAIKTELGKLEARDSSISSRYLRQARAPHHEPPGQDSAGTYKRYDVI